MAEPTEGLATPAAAEIEALNRETMDRLAWAIPRTDGFALFFAKCNLGTVRQQLIASLQTRLERDGIAVARVRLSPEEDPLQRLGSAYQPRHPQALLVEGLELLDAEDPATSSLAALNLSRERYAELLQCAVVIWATDIAVSRFATAAPDFFAWRSGVFEFRSVAAWGQEKVLRLEPAGVGADPWEMSLAERRQRLEDLRGVLRELDDLPATAPNQRERGRVLFEMGRLLATLFPPDEAMGAYRASLGFSEQIGDVRGKAATLHSMAGIVAQQGDVQRAMALYEDSLKLKEQIGDVRGKAATLANMAGIVAQQGDVQRAMALYEEAQQALEQIGDVRGKAATLHEMAGIVVQQGDVQRAMALYEDSLKLKEQIGDVQGKAATLHNMAVFVAQQGDVQRAMALYEDSLKLKEQIGDVRGKAATLANMAGIVAQQGDVQRAMALYEEAQQALEQIGDVRGKAATLANMARMAWEAEDRSCAVDLCRRAAEALSDIRAWLDLLTVLGNLGVADEAQASVHLAQALWLAARVDVPIDDAVQLAAALVQQLGHEHEAAHLVAAWGAHIAHTRGEKHPEREKMQALALAMLAACAESRGVTEKKFKEWLQREGLNDPSRFGSALDEALEAMVPEDEWMFDRSLVPPPSWGRA